MLKLSIHQCLDLKSRALDLLRTYLTIFYLNYLFPLMNAAASLQIKIGINYWRKVGETKPRQVEKAKPFHKVDCFVQWKSKQPSILDHKVRV